VAVAWFTRGGDGKPRVLVARSRDSGRTFGAPIEISAGDPLGRVDVHVFGDGSLLVTWLEAASGREALVRARRLTAEGATAEDFTLDRVSARRRSGFPRLDGDEATALLSWTRPGKPGGVASAFFRLGR